VSDAVIRVMINPHPEIRAVDNARLSPPAIENDGLPEEVGVYVALNGKLWNAVARGVSFRSRVIEREFYDKSSPFLRPHLLNLREAG
jgi:hypothetical protein